MNNTNKGVILALITVLCWGVLAVALKVAVKVVQVFRRGITRFAGIDAQQLDIKLQGRVGK